MRVLYDRGQSLQIHAAQVGRRAVAPAVGEHLDHVRLVRQRNLRLRVRLFRSSRGERHEIAPTGFGAVSAGSAHANRHIHVRPGHRPACKQMPHGSEHLAIGGVVVHRGDAAGEIGFEALAPIAGEACDGGRGEMRVQIEEAGQERLARGIDDARAGGNCGIGSNGFDLAAADDDGSHSRGATRTVHHARPANHDRVGLRVQDN